MTSWRDSDHLVERRSIEPGGWTRFDWLVLIVMVALNAALLVHRVVW